jgi:hypothetical protein
VTLRDKAFALLGSWSRPPDLPAKVAVALAALLALAVFFGRGQRLLFGASNVSEDDRAAERRRVPREIAVLGLGAALLSIAYIAIYLRGGPRIVDATTYFLQGRALSHGDLAWAPPPGPSASFHGRFLVHRDVLGDGETLGGIFPPGYPLVLALGFFVGAPMIVGPLLAFALVVATYRLARTLGEEVCPKLAEPVARGAALLSLVCAALRYHTADTMSHGASALGVTVALACALQARRARLAPPSADEAPFERGRLDALSAGLALGYVVATRPFSAPPIAIVVAWLLAPTFLPARDRRSRLSVLVLLGMVPGIVLLLVAQREVTGAWLTSTQRMYYAISDGPPGCFRWGFGKGIGCRFEHGDFVQARLERGHGLVEAAGTTLRRLHAHLLDVANFEPLALLTLVPLLVRRHFRGRAGVFAASALVGLQILVYAPFYFDGDYPGGGARFFADVLPTEHALVMVGLAGLALRASAYERRFARAAYGVLTLALVGFGVHAVHEHGKLRDRDGGHPMFEPDVLARASVTNGLVFVDTDHGFALGHDPNARPDKGVLVARLRNDDRDRILFDTMGRPPTWLYKLEPEAPHAPGQVRAENRATLTTWTPPASGRLLRFEAEAEWPALTQADGYAAPAWTDGCASGKRALVLTPEPGRRARVTITVPVPSVGEWSVELHTVGVEPSSTVVEASATIESKRWVWQQKPGDKCGLQAPQTLALRPPHALLTFEATGGATGIDWVGLQKVR